MQFLNGVSFKLLLPFLKGMRETLGDREINLGFAGFVGTTVLGGTQQVYLRAGWTWADTQSGGTLIFLWWHIYKSQSSSEGLTTPSFFLTVAELGDLQKTYCCTSAEPSDCIQWALGWFYFHIASPSWFCFPVFFLVLEFFSRYWQGSGNFT